MYYKTEIRPDHFQFSLMSLDRNIEYPEWNVDCEIERFAIATGGICISSMTSLNYDDLPILEDLITVEFTDIEPINHAYRFMEIFILRSENGLYELSSPATTNDGEKIYLGTDIMVRLYQFNADDHFLFHIEPI